MDLIELYNSGYGKYSDKGNVHTYVQGYYSKEFVLPQSKKNILEIGIMHGGSMMLWHEYFRGATIVGMDVAEDSLEYFEKNKKEMELECDRVTTHILDAYTEEALNLYKDNHFDYIIDDGPHSLPSQQYAVKHYLRKVRPGGKLIIEDVQDEKWFQHLRDAADPDLVAGTREIKLNIKHRYDDMIFEITRK